MRGDFNIQTASVVKKENEIREDRRCVRQRDREPDKEEVKSRGMKRSWKSGRVQAVTWLQRRE